MTDQATSASTTPQGIACPVDERQANRAFTTSMVVSGIRCSLTYVILPFVAPLVGLAGAVGPVLGLVIGLVALVSNAVSIRRFWRVRHRWRVPVTWAHAGVMVLVVVLVIGDLRALMA